MSSFFLFYTLFCFIILLNRGTVYVNDLLNSPVDLWTVIAVLLVEGGLGYSLLWRCGMLKSVRPRVVSILLLALAMGLRAVFFDYETLDYQNFLAHWVDVFRQYGGFRALNLSVGNYNIPYLYFMAFFSQLPVRDLYLIKLLSSLSDVLLAWSAALLCTKFTKDSGRLIAVFFAVLFLPTVFLNSAVWGQCDSLYAAPLLLGIWCALDGRPFASVVLAVAALGFKLQAVFVLPVWAVFLMTGKIRWRHVLIFPLAYFLLVLPAVIAGRPLWETVTLYFSQTGSIGDGLNYNSPSVFSVFTDIENKERAATVGIVLAFIYMLNLLAVSWVNRLRLSDRSMLALSLLFGIGIPFLLPHMHERYFYCADILSLTVAFSLPLYAVSALLTQWASLLGYHAYLKQRYLLLMNHGAAALAVAFALTLLCFLSSLKPLPGKRSRGGKRALTALLLSFSLSITLLSSPSACAFAEEGTAHASAGDGPSETAVAEPENLPQASSDEELSVESLSGEDPGALSPRPEITVIAPENPAPAYPEGAIRITEIMIRNHTTIQDEDGDFPDWVELHNESGADIVLEDWSLSDRERKPGLVFPAFLFPADSYCVIFCSGKDRPSTLHTPFSISAGENLWLRDPSGNLISEAACPDLKADRSHSLHPDGSWRECLYPTPGRENTTAAYDEWQSEQQVVSPLILNEVLVADPNGWFSSFGGSDWVELKNNSSSQLSLQGWYLSDNEDNYLQCALPPRVLEPGQITVIPTDQLGLSLGDENEALFLSHKDTGLCDRLYLRDIPLGGSFGRVSGQNGGYFFEKASPGEENRSGYRRVSATPVATTPDGVFSSSDTVVLDLEAEGSIFYTYDSTVPTQDSHPWPGPVRIPATSVIRAIACEKNALPSRPLTLSYFIGEDHSLPVLSLVSDNKTAFWDMYTLSKKNLEYAGHLALYSEEGAFSLPCGITMHGETSLSQRKKGMSVRFRGAYGAETLEDDLFGGGVTSFTNLLIRAGQDQTDAIIRNELCENLALSVSDHIIGSRSRYCVLYIDGEYRGIYALSEKLNEQHYANIAGVSRKSVTTITAEAPRDSDLYQDVFQYCETHDMSETEHYEHFLSLMDVDSLIDWVFLEGYFGNADLTYGNLRFCRSYENDGKWRFMFYDLDATLRDATRNHRILLRRNSVQCMQISYLMSDLIRNAEFRDRFLRRSAELLEQLPNEAVFREIDRLANQIRPEVARDIQPTGRSFSAWEKSISTLKNFFVTYDWPKHNVDAICNQLYVKADERAKYFGS